MVSSYNEAVDDEEGDDAVSQQPPQTKLAGKAGASDKTLAKIATSSAKLGQAGTTAGGGAALAGSLGKAAGKAAGKMAKAAKAAVGKAGAAAKSGALVTGAAGAGVVDFSSSEFVEPGLKKPAILVLKSEP